MKNKIAVQQVLEDCKAVLQTLFKQDVLGVYFYGSAVAWELQKYSDLDLLVVLKRKMTLEEKTRLVASLLQISGVYMNGQKPWVEMTIVCKSMINPWVYPPQFDFQYGEWLRDLFEVGNIEPWVTKEMPDLALIITQVLLKSKTLLGDDPEVVMAPVLYKDFITAMVHDVDRLADELDTDTRNVLLTYARIWSTLATDEIRSKATAADWVIQYLPENYKSVMRQAKLIYLGLEDENWHDLKDLLKPCVKFMIDEINVAFSLINFNDPNKIIKLAKS